MFCKQATGRERPVEKRPAGFNKFLTAEEISRRANLENGDKFPGPPRARQIGNMFEEVGQ